MLGMRKLGRTSEIRVMGRIHEVMRQRLVHVVSQL